MTTTETLKAEGMIAAGQPDDLASRPTRRPLPATAFVVVWALVTVGALALWFLAYGVAFSSVQEHRGQRVLYAELREQLALATAPFGGSAAAGAPVALLTSPDGGLRSIVVVQGTTASNLTRGPGHLADTPMPGQPGVSVLMGRSVTYGAPFAHLASLRAGSELQVTTGQGRFVYRVDRIRHPGDPVPAPPTATQSRLVLMSSTAGGWRTGWAPSQTVFVDATLQGKTVQDPGGRPTAVPAAAEPMQGEPAALVPLLLWLQALVLAAAGCTWAQARWGRRETWLVGFPMLLALLWGATATALLLLPNLM